MSQKHFGPFKIVILGEGRVGKTSLLRRYVSQSFDSDEASTQSAAYLDKVLQLRGTQVQLSLWDTAGQERFHALAPIYYRDADGALLVYDVTEPESFRRVAKWVEELQVAGPQCALAIVGNKCDLQSQVAVYESQTMGSKPTKNTAEPPARVPKADAESYARSINARHSVASAKLGHGVEETFGALVEDVLTSKATRSGAGGGRRTRGTIVVAEDEPAQRKGCCGGN
ncbi:unnamed protein product [Durusdinium trenchii]|uniref:Ras-related protein Rab-21 n=1 Tax=Durusdinium trenchii TaxID=1381693 RepID=A0ABP0IEU2_9DINO